MKKHFGLVVFVFILMSSSIAFAKKDKKEKQEDYYKVFTVEVSHAYNGLISKHGANAKFYFWVNKTYNFGPEFYFYFPTTASKSPDLQLDFNFRKITCIKIKRCTPSTCQIFKQFAHAGKSEI